MRRECKSMPELAMGIGKLLRIFNLKIYGVGVASKEYIKRGNFFPATDGLSPQTYATCGQCNFETADLRFHAAPVYLTINFEKLLNYRCAFAAACKPSLLERSVG